MHSLQLLLTGAAARRGWHRHCSSSLDSDLCRRSDAFLASFVNHEAAGVPRGAGADGADGFPLERMHALLDALDSPHTRFPVLHVGGSKGKGSTAAFLAAVLRACGLRVGVYSSPHAEHVRERVSTSPDGSCLTAAQYARLVARHQGAVAEVHARTGGGCTHFEVTTALALAHFAHGDDAPRGSSAAVDVAVVEVGLGGVRDATNVFSPANLEAAVVTTLDLEHLAALGGDSIHHVAAAKAGIYRPGRPAIMGPQTVPGAAQALLDAAASRGVHAVQDTSAVAVTALPGDANSGDAHVTQHVSFACGPTLVGEAHLQLLGPHQLRNCEAALAVLHAMHTGEACDVRHSQSGGTGWNITAGAIAQGLSSATLPGRFQVLRPPQQGERRPLVVVDGAHSPAAARALVDTLRHLGWHHTRRPLVLVLAAAADKDLRGMAQHLVQLAPEACIATSVPVAGARVRAAASGDIAAAWGAACAAAGVSAGRVEEQAELAAALGRACDVTGPDGLVCVTGSLHLAFQAARLLQ